MFLKDFLESKIVDDSFTSNYQKKEFLKRFNKLIFDMGINLKEHKTLSYNSVLKYIKTIYLLSDYSARKYLEFVINRKVFEYNPIEKTFSLPDYVIIENTK